MLLSMIMGITMHFFHWRVAPSPESISFSRMYWLAEKKIKLITLPLALEPALLRYKTSKITLKLTRASITDLEMLILRTMLNMVTSDAALQETMFFKLFS